MRVRSLSTTLLVIFTTLFSQYSSVLAEDSDSDPESILRINLTVEPRTNRLNSITSPLEDTTDARNPIIITQNLFSKETTTPSPIKRSIKSQEDSSLVSEDSPAVTEIRRLQGSNDRRYVHKYSPPPASNVRGSDSRSSTNDFECSTTVSIDCVLTKNPKRTEKSYAGDVNFFPSSSIPSNVPPNPTNNEKPIQKRSAIPYPETSAQAVSVASAASSTESTDMGIIIVAASAGSVGVILIVVVLVVWLRIRAGNRKGYYPAGRYFRDRRNTLNLETPVSRYRRTRQIDSTSSFGDCGTPSDLWRRPSQWKRRSASPPPPLPIPAPVMLKDPVPRAKKLPKNSLTYGEGGVSPSGTGRTSAATSTPYSPSNYDATISPKGLTHRPQPPPAAVIQPFNPMNLAISPSSDYSPNDAHAQQSFISPIDPSRGFFAQELGVIGPYLRDSYMDGSPPPPRYSAVTKDQPKGKEKVQDMKKGRGTVYSWGSLCEYYYYYA
ncbi:hypothetical protein RUND412_000298 [Rhizina undulata]